MKSIQRMIFEFIDEGGAAVLENVDGVRGVRFTDIGGEWMPWTDIGFNSQYGFYSLSHLQSVENEAKYEDWTIHSIDQKDPNDEWEGFAILDGDGFGFVVGERWKAEELHCRLVRFLLFNEQDEKIDYDDESLGTLWYSTSEAVKVAMEYDPDQFETVEKTRQRIQRAAGRGSIKHGKTPSGQLKFQSRVFRGWLAKAAQRRK